MKVSIILPSLFESLAARTVQNLLDTSGPIDIEIVLVAPFTLTHPQVVSVVDNKLAGAVSATALGFEHSTGDVVVTVPDDWLTGPQWLSRGLSLLTKHPKDDLICVGFPLWDTPSSWIGTVYGRYYAYTPMCFKDTAIAVGGFYDPAYRGGWADPDFCMRVWDKGGKVLICRDSYVSSVSDRNNQPEGPEKTKSFASDMATFISRWQPIYGAGWRDEFRSINLDVPASSFPGDTFFMPNANDMDAFIFSQAAPITPQRFAGWSGASSIKE